MFEILNVILSIQWSAHSSRPFSFFRIVYDVSRCFVQFVLPLGVVLCMYISIFYKLKERPLSQHSENNQRRRRTNIMLISVSIIFFLSWLPLNTLNFLLDFNSDIINVSQIHTNGSIFENETDLEFVSLSLAVEHGLAGRRSRHIRGLYFDGPR